MKRTWAFVAILLSALLLTGCGLLSASLFPAYLSLAVDAVSVAEFIGDPLTTETNLSVLNNGAGDMLFLVVRRPGQPETLVLIAGEPLEVLGSVTQDELNLVTGLLPPDQGYFGRLRMVDASLNFVVGNFMFSPDFGTTTENFSSLNTYKATPGQGA